MDSQEPSVAADQPEKTPKVSFPVPVTLDPDVTPAALRTYGVLRAYVLEKLPNPAVPGNDLIEHPDEAELKAFREVMYARRYADDQFTMISLRALIDQELLDEAFRLYVLLRFSAVRFSKGTHARIRKDEIRRGLRLKPGEIQRLLKLCARAGYVEFQELQGGFLDVQVYDEPKSKEDQAEKASSGQKVDTPSPSE